MHPFDPARKAKLAAAGQSKAVLMAGERGTRERVTAEAIHDGSRHRGNGFASIDCSSFDDFRRLRDGALDFRHLMEGEEGGTIYLSNIDALDLRDQIALLQLIERGRVPQ